MDRSISAHKGLEPFALTSCPAHIKGELTIAQITSKYGVHSTQIQQWKKKGLEYLMSGFQNKVKSKHIDNEELIKQLYEQIGQLNMECNWLKKKSTLFGL
jgi:hypothetical protein